MSLKKLVIKDFQANKTYTLLGLALVFVLTAVLMVSAMLNDGGGESASQYNSVMTRMYSLIIVLVIRMTSFLYLKIDDMYSIDGTIASLPVTRKDVVYSRYVSSGILLVLAIIIQLLVTLIVELVFGARGDSALSFIHEPAPWFFVLLLFLFFNSLSFPFYFRFGTRLGVLIVVIAQFLVVVLVFTVLNNLGDSFNWFERMEEFLEWTLIENLTESLILCALFVALLVTVSAKLSAKIYKTRDI